MFVHLQTYFRLIFLMSLFNACFCNYKKYDKYSLLRVTPTTASQLHSLSNLHAKHAHQLEFWMRTSSVNHSADVMVKPAFKSTYLKELAALRIPCKTLIEDIGKLIREDRLTPEQRAKLGFFEAYHSVIEMDEYFEALVNKFPDCLSLIPIGVSYEGRLLQVLRITANKLERKPGVWIQGGAHAREPIGPATVAFIATELACLCYKENEELYELLNSFEWYILPILNPDGYEYAQNTDRLWRKTRSCHPNPKNCIGVDPNRNWDIKWNDASGSSLDPCSYFYAGPSAFSEPETKAVSKFMLDNLKGRLVLFIDFHSYSQRWSTPYGYTPKLPKNYREQVRLANVAARAIEMVNGTKYTTGTTRNIVYAITGGARDWVYDVICAKYAYIVELRDKGRFGFLLPRRFILPTALETWEGVKIMGLDLAEKMYIDSYSN